MKPEILDSLVLDRAVGELTPETAALLEAYLAQNPAAALRAATLTGTLDLARATFPKPGAAPRPLDVTRLHQAHRAARRRTRATQMLRLAACLAIGLIGGWCLRPAPKIAPPAIVSAPIVTPRAPETGTQFWSISRFAPEVAEKNQRRKL